MRFKNILCAVCIAAGSALAGTPVPALLDTVRAVGPEGRGNAEAAAAWAQLAKQGADVLPRVLAAMDGANELAVNWLRAVVDTVAARELAAGRGLPAADLEAFLQDTHHAPRARRLAYELLQRVDPARAERLVAGMIDDPAGELRREAVQRRMDEAAALQKAGDNAPAIARYEAVLKSVRDVDQVESVAKALKELGRPPDLNAVFGWLTQWQVVGPFDNAQRAGFDRVFPPEERVDLGGEYDGKSGKVRWQAHRSKGDTGLVDLNPVLGLLKEVTGYAYAEFEVASARPVELRLGCGNAWKIWLNGQFLFGRDEYHRGYEIDQYRLAAQLKPGRNTLLVKVCQNEQVEDWTKEWEFQLRITDALGTPIPLVKR